MRARSAARARRRRSAARAPRRPRSWPLRSPPSVLTPYLAAGLEVDDRVDALRARSRARSPARRSRWPTVSISAVSLPPASAAACLEPLGEPVAVGDRDDAPRAQPVVAALARHTDHGRPALPRELRGQSADATCRPRPRRPGRRRPRRPRRRRRRRSSPTVQSPPATSHGSAAGRGTSARLRGQRELGLAAALGGRAQDLVPGSEVVDVRADAARRRRRSRCPARRGSSAGSSPRTGRCAAWPQTG